MAGSVNKVILIGNLGADPEVRYTEAGQCVATISLATNRNYTNRNNEKVKETEWHRVVLWRKLGEIAEKYLRKGSTVYIEGRLQTRKSTDQNGMEKYTTEIVGENMTMLGGRSDETGSHTQQQAAQVQEQAVQPNTVPSDQPQWNQETAQQAQSQPVAQPTVQPQQQSAANDMDDLPF